MTDPTQRTAAASRFPYKSGDHIIIGPECFADAEVTVICYKGENFYRGEVA